MPMEAASAPGCCRSSAWIEATVACHHASGSCSAQPGFGVEREIGVVAEATTSPAGLTKMALTPLVPTSRPRKSESATLSHSEQELHGELVELLVSVTLRAHGLEVEALVLERLGALLREL